MKQGRIYTVIGNEPWIDAAKQILDSEGAVQVHFVAQNHWYGKRKEIFRSFKGVDITIERKTRTEAYVLLVNERIRTSYLESTRAPKPLQKSAEQLHYPEKLSLSSRGALTGFYDVEDTIVEINGVLVYSCACCGRYLPAEEFGSRYCGGKTYRQSYCAPCLRLYSVWYRQFTREHNVERITPQFTIGNKKRNEIFRQWYAENVEME